MTQSCPSVHHYGVYNGGITPFILNCGARWGLMVHFNTSDNSPMGKQPMAYAEQEDGWAPEIMWTVWTGDVSPLQESELQFLRYPAQGLEPEKCHTLSWLYKVTFIHLVVCFTTGPKPLPKRALHLVRSRASSFK
jgi:hypothetical protein